MLGRSAFLSSPVDASLGEIVIVVTVCGVNQASPVVCIRTEVVGGFTTIGAVVPEPAIPAFLGVVVGSSTGVDCGYHTTRLGPSYRFSIWLDPFYNVVYAGGYLGPFEAFFNIDSHFGQLSFLFVVFSSFGQYEFLVSFQSSVPPL